MIIDTKKVEALLNDESISYGHILDVTGLSKGAVYPYRSGNRDITVMSIEVASKLQNLYEEIKGEEKQMSINIKGIKKAVGEFNNWQEQARIYFDMEDLHVWTNVYPGGNESWDNYHDKNIVEVVSKRGMVAQDNDYLSMRELKNLCINKLK